MSPYNSGICIVFSDVKVTFSFVKYKLFAKISWSCLHSLFLVNLRIAHFNFMLIYEKLMDESLRLNTMAN